MLVGRAEHEQRHLVRMRLDRPDDEVDGVFGGRLGRRIADGRLAFERQVRLGPRPAVGAEIFGAPPQPLLGLEPRLPAAHQRLAHAHEHRNVGAADQFELAQRGRRAVLHPRVAGHDGHAEHLDAGRVEQHEQRHGVVVQHAHVGVDDDPLGGAGRATASGAAPPARAREVRTKRRPASDVAGHAAGLQGHLADAIEVADIDRDRDVGRIAVVEEVIEPCAGGGAQSPRRAAASSRT